MRHRGVRARLARRAWTAIVSGLALGSAPLLASASHGAVVRVEQPGNGLAAALAAARPGDVIELGPGRYAGPVRIDRALILRGSGGVIDGGDSGTPLRIAAAGARVEGVTIRGSGTDVGAPDACVFVESTATGAVVQGNTLEDCAFGIWVHQADGVQVVENHVRGRSGVRVSDRGNGIHLFDCSNALVRGNVLEGVRDGVYVSATEQSVIEGNRAHGVRFGIHYMYSYSNQIRANVTDDSVVGIALMESRHLEVEDNEASGNDRQGLLFRDVQDSQIRRNRLERNGTGMFFYSSTENVIEDNVIVGNDTGMKVWAGSRRNRVEGNVIQGNREQVFYVSAEDQIWGESGRGNHWGDYLGWDQNGDGIGDRPYRVDSFTAGLLYRYPSAALLMRSPALETLAHLADSLPILRTPTIIDVAPLIHEAAP